MKRSVMRPKENLSDRSGSHVSFDVAALLAGSAPCSCHVTTERTHTADRTGFWQVCTDYGRSFWEEREVILREHAQIAETVAKAVAAVRGHCGRCGLESQDTGGHAACASQHVNHRVKTSPSAPTDACERTLESPAASSGAAVATVRLRREVEETEVCDASFEELDGPFGSSIALAQPPCSPSVSRSVVSNDDELDSADDSSPARPRAQPTPVRSSRRSHRPPQPWWCGSTPSHVPPLAAPSHTLPADSPQPPRKRALSASLEGLPARTTSSTHAKRLRRKPSPWWVVTSH